MATVKYQKHHLSLSFLIETHIFTLELQHIEINAFPSQSTVYLAKTKATTNLRPSRHSFLAAIHVTQ